MTVDALADGRQLIAALFSVLVLGACSASAVPRAARIIALVALAGAALIAVALLAEVYNAGAIRYAFGGWSAPVGIEFVADGIGAVMAVVSMVIMFACMFAPGSRALGAPFWVMWMWTALALVMLFLGADLFNAYVALELLGLCAAALVAMAGGRAALLAAVRYLLVGLVASAVYLLGVAVIYAQTGSLSLREAFGGLESDGVAGLALGLMTAGLLMKSAAFPFHAWLPPAHANAPVAASAVLSALVIKGAIIFSWRMWDALPPGFVSSVVGTVVGALGLCAIVWGSVHALRAQRLKVILAFSTVAQVGFLLLVLAMLTDDNTAALGPGLLLLIVHALAKAGAFCAAGMIIAHLGSDRLEDLKGMAASMPLTTLALAMASIALVGLPPSGSFIAKWQLLSLAAADAQWLWVIAMVVGTFFSAIYLLRPMSIAFTDMENTRKCETTVGAVVALILALAAFALTFAAGHLFELVARGGALE